MLKQISLGAAALTVMAAAAPALAGHDDWDDDDRRWRHGRYERVDYDRYEHLVERAYRDGLYDGRRGHRREARDYRVREARQAYKNGYRDGKRERRDYARHDDWRQPVHYRDRDDYRGGWYGRNGRYYGSYEQCRRSDKINVGTVAGGALGGVLGHEIAGRGDRTIGTIIGVAAGAVIGHEIGKDGNKRRYCY